MSNLVLIFMLFLTLINLVYFVFSMYRGYKVNGVINDFKDVNFSLVENQRIVYSFLFLIILNFMLIVYTSIFI